MMSEGTLVKEVWFNWFHTDNGGEEYNRATTLPSYRYLAHDGKWYENPTPTQLLAEKLVYHEPRGEGDKHYVDIYWVDGSLNRIFNINKIIF